MHKVFKCRDDECAVAACRVEYFEVRDSPFRLPGDRLLDHRPRECVRRVIPASEAALIVIQRIIATGGGIHEPEGPV